MFTVTQCPQSKPLVMNSIKYLVQNSRMWFVLVIKWLQDTEDGQAHCTGFLLKVGVRNHALPENFDLLRLSCWLWGNIFGHWHYTSVLRFPLNHHSDMSSCSMTHAKLNNQLWYTATVATIVTIILYKKCMENDYYAWSVK